MNPDDTVFEEAIAVGEEVLAPHDRATEESVRRQMDTMSRHDRWMAWACVVALIIVLPFVFITMWDNMPSTPTKVVLAGSGALLLLYNVASVLALVRNFARDRDFIYRRDVAHLREQRALRQALKARS